MLWPIVRVSPCSSVLVLKAYDATGALRTKLCIPPSRWRQTGRSSAVRPPQGVATPAIREDRPAISALSR